MKEPTLITLARLRASLDRGLDRHAVLATASLDEAKFAAFQEEMLVTLADDLDRGELTRVRQYDEAYRSAEEALGPAPADAPAVPEAGADAAEALEADAPPTIRGPLVPAEIASANVATVAATREPVPLPRAAEAMIAATEDIDLSEIEKGMAARFRASSTSDQKRRTRAFTVEERLASPLVANAPIAMTEDIDLEAIARAVSLPFAGPQIPMTAPSGSDPEGDALLEEGVSLTRYVTISASLASSNDPASVLATFGLSRQEWMGIAERCSKRFAADPILQNAYETRLRAALAR